MLVEINLFKILLFVKKHYGILTIVIGFLLYSLIWSYITILKLYTMNQPFWDLGDFEQRGLQVLDYHWTPGFFLYTFLGSEFTFIVFPITMFRSLQLILVVQSLALGISVFPLYGIAKHYFDDKKLQLLITIPYLFYFPMAGLNWFSAHYQMFFVPLFIFAYYLLLRKNYKSSIILFLLSGMVRYPFILLILLFSVIGFISLFLDYYSNKSVKVNMSNSQNYKSDGYDEALVNDNFIFYSILIVSSSAITLLSFFYEGLWHETISNQTGLRAATVLGPGIVQAIKQNLNNKLLTLLLIFLPYLFFFFFSKKWVTMLIPYFALLFLSDNLNYVFPYVFTYQYSSLFAPFVVIGSIEGLYNFSTHFILRSFRTRYQKKKKNVKTYKDESGRKKTVATFIVIVSVSSAFIFEPYGPLNSKSPVDFNLGVIGHENLSYYQEMNEMLSLIPYNNSNIIFQNVFPEVALRNFGNDPILTNYVIYPNCTYFNVEAQKFEPIQNIDYIFVSTFVDAFEFLGTPLNTSLFQITYNALSSGKFGILAEAYGMLLLERNYSGPIKYFVPFDQYVPVTELYNARTNNLITSPIISWNNTHDQSLWYGPYNVLAPGLYKVTYEIETSNNSPNNHLTISNGANLPITTFNSLQIDGNYFARVNTWTNISTLMYLNNVYAYIKMNGYQATWNGTISLRGIWIQEVSG